MNLYLEFVMITACMVITYNIIALKYRRSQLFFSPSFGPITKMFLVSLHVFIVITNIAMYFWLIISDFNRVPFLLMIMGYLIFAIGLLLIFWGIFELKNAVFVPETKFVIKGPFKMVRHPMYSGGIIGAAGIAMFAGSILGIIYSIILAIMLAYVSNVEERDLITRFGQEYIDYTKKVPKLVPDVRRMLI